MFSELNLPQAPLQIKDDRVWDVLQKKTRLLTPEEWVRQHFIHFLIDQKEIPAAKMASEVLVEYNRMKKRADIVIYDAQFRPVGIVECKAPKIKITEDTFYQIARYCHTLGASVLILTNGIEHYCAHIDKKEGTLNYLKEIPSYSELLKMR